MSKKNSDHDYLDNDAQVSEVEEDDVDVPTRHRFKKVDITAAAASSSSMALSGINNYMYDR